MIVEVCFFLTAGAVLAVALVLAWYRQRLQFRERSSLPEDLKDASVEFAERLFHTKRPFPLFAKIDRAYTTADGQLVLTELKRRFRPMAFRSDVVELSAQRLAIERGFGRRVSSQGFVVVEHPATRERTPIPVALLREPELVALRQRYQQLVVGAAVPQKANDVRLCRSCAYASSCKPQILRNDSGTAVKESEAASRVIRFTPDLDPLSAAGARDGRPARRRATGRSLGKSKTRARKSPRSDRNRRT